MATVDFTTPRKITFPCEYALDVVLFSVGEIWSCLIDNRHMPLDHVLYMWNMIIILADDFMYIFMYCDLHA